MDQNKCVVLNKGGLESAALLVWAKKHFKVVESLYVGGDHTWEGGPAIDAGNLTMLVLGQSTIACGLITQEESKINNMLLLTVAAQMASQREAGYILMGLTADDAMESPANTREFLLAQEAAIQRALGDVSHSYNVCAPFINKTKQQVIEWLHENGSLHLAAFTFYGVSSYLKRQAAFVAADLPDPFLLLYPGANENPTTHNYQHGTDILQQVRMAQQTLAQAGV